MIVWCSRVGLGEALGAGAVFVVACERCGHMGFYAQELRLFVERPKRAPLLVCLTRPILIALRNTQVTGSQRL